MIEDAALLSAHTADAPVAWTSGRTTTAAELVAHVAGFAELLPPADGPEEVVVICRDRYRFLVAILAAWKRGYVAALPPNAQVETIRALRCRPGVRTVIHDVDGADDKGIDVRAADVVRAAREKVGRLPFEAFEPPPKDRHLLTVYTSGSTGEHTACPKTTRQVLGEASLLARTFRMHETPRVLTMVPAYHIYGLLFGILTPLSAGGCFHRATPLHAEEIGAIMANGGVDALVSVPAHLRGLLVAKAGELPPVRRVFSSAAPLPPTVAAELRERFGWTITEGFGSSETGGIAWRESGGEGPWVPFEGVRVRADEEGRMLVDSPFVHPDGPHPYVGADRVEVAADGTFTHLGRVDGVLKIGGVRVALAEIENRLRALPGVRDAAVVSRPVDGPRGHEILAVVVTDGVDVADVRRELRRWLAPVALPRRMKRVDALPRTAGGKVRKRDVLACFGLAADPSERGSES